MVLGIVTGAGKICPRPQTAFPVQAERICGYILRGINVSPRRKHVPFHFHGLVEEYYAGIASDPEIPVRHTDDIMYMPEPVPSQIHFRHFSRREAHAEKPLHRTYEKLAVRHYDELVYPLSLEDRLFEQRYGRNEPVIRHIQIAVPYIGIASSPCIEAYVPRIAVRHAPGSIRRRQGQDIPGRIIAEEALPIHCAPDLP